MSSTTSGSFTPSSASADLAKEVGSHVAVIPAGGNVAQVVNPAVPQQAVTVFNLSTAYVRATVTLSAGITAVGAAATRVFLVPPNATYSLDLGNTNDDAGGIVEAIDSISFQAIATPTATAEVSTLAVAGALAANAIIIANFGTR
ncbi:MAG: hypothetical protein ACRCW4_14160 [Candidatus Neomicrothrix subdominans]